MSNTLYFVMSVISIIFIFIFVVFSIFYILSKRKKRQIKETVNNFKQHKQEQFEVATKVSKPHYRLMTNEEKNRVDTIYFAAEFSGPGIGYNFPPINWNEENAFSTIHKVKHIIGWNITYINNDFYHIEWRLRK